jgi:hypothetical protein
MEVGTLLHHRAEATVLMRTLRVMVAVLTSPPDMGEFSCVKHALVSMERSALLFKSFRW